MTQVPPSPPSLPPPPRRPRRPPPPSPLPSSTPCTAPVAPAAAPEPSGLVGRLFGRAEAQVEEPRRALDDEMLEELEDMLIAADMGTDTALRVTANIAEGRMGRRVTATELKRALADEVTRIMQPVARPLPLYPRKPQVVLVVGVVVVTLLLDPLGDRDELGRTVLVALT